MCMQRLSREIEGLRSEMIRVAEHKGSLVDPQVIALSQQLDQLLVLMQRLKCGGGPSGDNSVRGERKNKVFTERFQ